MEKGFEYWFHNQHTEQQSPYSNSVRDPLDLGQSYTVPAFTNACPNMLSPNGSLPVYAFSSEQTPHMKASQPTEPQGWFYCMPRFRQAYAPVQNSLPKEKLPPCLNGVSKEAGASADVQKRFVVFDQSGDQTTLIFSSGIGGPAQYQHLPSWSTKPYCAFDMKNDELRPNRDAVHSFPPLSVDDYNIENEQNDSEMHEDTEELNALLYSDDEIDYSDEQETSTGHSPSTMTGNDIQEWQDETGEEEVASSMAPAKRQKLDDGCCGVPSLKYTANSGKMNTANSGKMNKPCLDNEDDAESSCGDGKDQVIEESGSARSLSGIKRSRKEKIRETISILQNLIPSGRKGQDAVVLLDEAINYLTSLKVKAKILGLNSL